MFTSKMFIQTHFFRHSGILPASLGLPSSSLAVCSLSAVPNEWLRRCVNFEMLPSVSGKWNYPVQLNGTKNASFPKMKNHSAIFSSSQGQGFSVHIGKKRKVVEHVCLLKAKEDLSDEKEEDMLDYLYTSQYQMGGIVAVSLGRISDENPENYTHALYMRFQRKEDLTKFYNNPFYSGVLKDYVMPYCHGLINVDYESEVEDDILPIFRKGEDFNYGVEFILLIEFVESALGKPVEDALASLEKLAVECSSLIVQATQGLNFNQTNNEYTHGAVIRFRSIEAFDMFMGSIEYKDMWRSKFQPITQKALPIYFTVDPVGTEIM